MLARLGADGVRRRRRCLYARRHDEGEDREDSALGVGTRGAAPDAKEEEEEEGKREEGGCRR